MQRPIRPLAWFSFAMALVLLPGAGAARSDDTPEPPKTVVVKAAPFTVVVELSGTFTPRGETEVSYDPKAYGGELKVVQAVDLGPVTTGQDLVSFDTKTIDDQIEAKTRELALARLRFQKQEDDTARKKEALDIQVQQAEIRRRIAAETLDQWRTVDKPMRIEQSELGVQATEDRIQDDTEELQQLEKMYKEDDLTEETEEIVLRRARRSLERGRKSLEMTRTRHRLLLEVTIPREEEDKVLDLRKQELELESVKVAARIALEQARIELEKARADLDHQTDALKDLEADRDALQIKAPTAGLAVPGAFQGGKWAKLAEMRESLTPDGKVGARQTLYTIIQPGDVGVSTRVKEVDLLKLKVGQDAAVKPAVLKDKTLPARVTEILPLGSGEFDVTLDLQETDPLILPGYACSVEIEVRKVEGALTVPASALRKQGDKQVVYVWKDGEAQQREVKVGDASGNRVEIVDGLAAGESVLQKAPEKP
jgi:HlyD family secretion protein